jgi:hypothetical protein
MEEQWVLVKDNDQKSVEVIDIILLMPLTDSSKTYNTSTDFWSSCLTKTRCFSICFYFITEDISFCYCWRPVCCYLKLMDTR